MYENYNQIFNLRTGYPFEKQCKNKYNTPAVPILMIISSVWRQLSTNRSRTTLKMDKNLPLGYLLVWAGGADFMGI